MFVVGTASGVSVVRMVIVVVHVTSINELSLVVLVGKSVTESFRL